MARDRMRAVRRVREIRERQARAGVSRARATADRAQEEIAQRRRDEVMAMVDELTAIRLRAMQLSGVVAVELTEAARADARRADAEAEEATRRWAEASARSKSAERLADRRTADAAVVSMRASHKSLDELVMLMRDRRDHRARP